MVKIAPSILAADSSSLGKEIKCLQNAKADYIHFDVMDGHFVPNITFGPKILRENKKFTNLPFDTHLMVTNPERFIPWFADAGADIITFHLEAVSNPDEIINLIKSYGKKAGISIKPDTDIAAVFPYCNLADLILIMAVEPGFGGQTFLENTPDRIHHLKQFINSSHTLIEVDGGINPITAKLCIDAGADILVAGTSVFKNGDYAENIRRLRKGEPQ